MTKVICLYGGPGAGKSILAAEIYFKMNVEQLNCELVREYCKEWAYENRQISTFDQFYLIGKQIRKESFLYGKVQHIVTDSPLWIGAFYDNLYQGTDHVGKHVQGFTQFAESKGVEYYNFILRRHFAYDPNGRYQTEEQAIEIDTRMKEFLDSYGVRYQVLDMPVEERADYIVGLFKQ